MHGRPFRLILLGYGAAALAVGATTLATPLSTAGALAAIWIGGALATIALAAAAASRTRAAAPQDDADAALAEALRRWDADLRADRERATAAPASTPAERGAST